MNKPKLIYTFENPFIAAASGLTLVDGNFYIVADDELGLVVLPQNLQEARILKVFEGLLPEEKKARKKIKPDFEGLVYLETKKALLCMPSGSKSNRTVGAIVSLVGKVTHLSFENVFKHLEKYFSELNLEGAVIQGEIIKLFQRGNGKHHQNAVIDLNLSSFLKDEVKDLVIHEVDLGKLKNIPLSFTDATLYENDIWFLAVAEDTESTFEDGEFAGAVLGRLSHEGKIEDVRPLEMTSKPEGLVIDQGIIYFVTDDDDRKIASRLYSARF
jgi:hypothetical protein